MEMTDFDVLDMVDAIETDIKKELLIEDFFKRGPYKGPETLKQLRRIINDIDKSCSFMQKVRKRVMKLYPSSIAS